MFKKFTVLAIAALAAAYGVSAMAPAKVQATTLRHVATAGTFTQDFSVHPLFIHITVADILHNDPCQPDPGSRNIVCGN